tara:strand:- start:7153 stop:7395 length:243 start_codon:yes stop_codon:yes gene_type:complete
MKQNTVNPINESRKLWLEASSELVEKRSTLTRVNMTLNKLNYKEDIYIDELKLIRRHLSEPLADKITSLVVNNDYLKNRK